MRAVSCEVPGAVCEEGAAASAEMGVLRDRLVGDRVVGSQAVGPVLLQVAQGVLCQAAGKGRKGLSAAYEGEGDILRVGGSKLEVELAELLDHGSDGGGVLLGSRHW